MLQQASTSKAISKVSTSKAIGKVSTSKAISKGVCKGQSHSDPVTWLCHLVTIFNIRVLNKALLYSTETEGGILKAYVLGSQTSHML